MCPNAVSRCCPLRMVISSKSQNLVLAAFTPQSRSFLCIVAVLQSVKPQSVATVTGVGLGVLGTGVPVALGRWYRAGTRTRRVRVFGSRSVSRLVLRLSHRYSTLATPVRPRAHPGCSTGCHVLAPY
ncbi:hypothetical protein C8R47DRAFT_1165621 [Mycena vitilis]|nr:hypothetical protein C8R47DRAFT_1165621 [Mycena vitilis]